MLKEQTGETVGSPDEQANTKVLERHYCEIAREVYQAIHTSGLDKFTFSLIDSLWNDLMLIIYELERLPRSEFNDLLEVSGGLSEAANELRLARFLFEVEEINAVY